MEKISSNLIKSPHRGKWNGTDLIIDKERVKEHAEVLTPPNIVSDMLDMLGEITLDMTFLEPSCGTGNFLVQILERKLRLCSSKEDIFKAVSTIYGVDIQKDNVLESRLRLLEIVEGRCSDADFLSVIADVLEKNIVGGDTLADRWGCMLDGHWSGGYVSNETGSVEEDSISRSHGRIVMYSWTWTSSGVEKKAEFLIEDSGVVDEPVKAEVAKVEVKSQSDLMAYFKGAFSGYIA